MSRGLLRTWARNNGYEIHEKELRDWVSRSASIDAKEREKEGRKMVDRYLSMAKTMEREGVWPADVWTRVIQPLVKVYCALEDKEGAMHWGKRAKELTTVATGSDGGWRTVVECPEGTGWWGLRKGKQTSA